MQLKNMELGFNTLGHVLCALLAQHDVYSRLESVRHTTLVLVNFGPATESCVAYTANAVRYTHDRVGLV